MIIFNKNNSVVQIKKTKKTPFLPNSKKEKKNTKVLFLPQTMIIIIPYNPPTYSFPQTKIINNPS